MRLTLRTLLAWKDDTLEPHQVREIGKQVAESPFAQELSDRIDRVTRQRRLSVPAGSGPEGTDANLVASYLDNELDPDAVADYEKRCLTSDVNLAEAASVHQILSLLGQKVKVPAEARARMYQLVKGREALTPRPSPASRPAVKEPVTKPIQPWVVPEPPRRPWLERFGPAVACLLLIGLSSWAAWKSLTMPPQVATAPAPVVAAGEGGAVADSDAVAPAAEPAKVAAAGETTKAQPEATPEAAGATKAPDLAKSKPAPPPVVPAGSAGLAEKTDGVLLRSTNEDRREWERLLKETPLKTSDHLLCLEPFRATIDLGKLRIGLVRETEVRILSRPSDPVPAIELLQGKVVIRQPASSALRVAFAKESVTLEMLTDTVVGMERVAMMMYGQPITTPQALGVICQQGEVTLTVGGKPQALKATNVALVEPGGQISVVTREDLPSWVAQAEPTPFELQVKEQFLKSFHADQNVLRDLAVAVEDERPETKNLSVAALKALGDLSLLTPILSRPNDPVARRATVAALRSYMMQGPEASGRVRAALDQEFGEESLGGLAQHMLIGYTPEEAAKPDLYNRLVGLLAPQQGISGESTPVGIREMALDTLKRLTGRDDLGYNPDQPAGKGFDAWNDLLRRNELHSPAVTPPRPARAKTQRRGSVTGAPDWPWWPG